MRVLMAVGTLYLTQPVGGAPSAPQPPTDGTAMRRAIESHYATAADPKTVALSSELYAGDAVLEFPLG